LPIFTVAPSGGIESTDDIANRLFLLGGEESGADVGVGAGVDQIEAMPAGKLSHVRIDSHRAWMGADDCDLCLSDWLDKAAPPLELATAAFDNHTIPGTGYRR
jgi:hypothetical protein